MFVMILTTSLLILTNVKVTAYDIRSIRLYNLRNLGFKNMVPASNLALHLRPSVLHSCRSNNVLIECPVYQTDFSRNMIPNNDRNFQTVIEEHEQQDGSMSRFERTAQIGSSTDQPSPFRRMMSLRPAISLNMLPSSGKSGGYALHQDNVHPISYSPASKSIKLHLKLNSLPIKHSKSTSTESIKDDLQSWTISPHEDLQDVVESTVSTDYPSSTTENSLQDLKTILKKFDHSLDGFERKFYTTTFSKLTSISPPSRRENGMSFVQSGLFLQLSLMALSTAVSPEARREIDQSLGLHVSDQEIVQLINATVSSLPASNEDLRFRWSSRLVLRSQNVSEQFVSNAAPALRLQIDRFNGTESPKEMAVALNHMIEVDSGGAIHSTFDEDDLSEGVCAILITTLYLRARWRSAPTLLNGTRPFHDSENAPRRTARMIRVNDVMRYADLTEWDAEALEIFYSTPGLSLLMLVPRGNSLKRLVDEAVSTGVEDISERMQHLRIAAILPLYTLRMTLLLPNKLEAMNISRLVDTCNGSHSGSFHLSNAVQRIMFWAEAGRNAFKDDGFEWDEPPERELVVDRPYIFYVRWKNKTLMNGNFVL